MAEELVTVDWSNEEELLKEEEEEEKKAEEAAKEAEKNEAKGEDKKDEAMDTSEVKEGEEDKDEVKKTLLACVLRGPVKVTNLQIRDLLARELQGVLHKSVNTQIDFVTKVGTVHLNFDPKNDKQAVEILKKLSRFQHANKEVKIQCSRAVACLLGFELRRQGVGPAPPGTLQFDKVLFLYNIPAETTEEVLRAMFECPICIIPLDEEGKNFGCAFLEFRSKKAAKACHSTNTEIEIGEVKCTLYQKFLIGGTKEEDDEVEKEERDRKKKEQDRKSMEGQKRKGNQQQRGGAGKSFNRGQAIKQKFNRARQMGQFGGQGGFSGDGMGQGVSPNLMMNQMMAMMRMSQNMGGSGGSGSSRMGFGRGGGSGGSGGGMGRGMNRMGGQRPMSTGGMGGGMGYDDYSSDYGYDDYESGYGGGRNMGGGGMSGNMGGGMGGRRQQQMMGGNRRGQMGSESSNHKDSVVDLFESALDTVDTQIGNPGQQKGRRGNNMGQTQRGRFQEDEFSGSRSGTMGDSYGGRQNRSGLMGDNFNEGQGRSNFSGGQGRDNFVDNNYSGGQRMGDYMHDSYDSGQVRSGNMKNSYSRGQQMSSDSKHGKFDNAANQRLIRLAGNYNQADLNMAGGEDEFGGGKNVHLNLDGEGRGGGNMQTQYGDFQGGNNQGVGGARSDYDNYDARSDRNQPVSYPGVYSSQESSGMFGSNSTSPKKRRFTEEPVQNYGMSMDDLVFKKPNFSMFQAQKRQQNQNQKKKGKNFRGSSGPMSMSNRRSY